MDHTCDVIAAALDAIDAQQEQLVGGDGVSGDSKGTDEVAPQQRHAHGAPRWPGFDMLVADVLRQTMSNQAVALAWLTRDPQLQRLYDCGLGFALRVLNSREASQSFIESTHTNCFIFLQHSVALVARHLPPRSVLAWRRAARQAGMLNTVATVLQQEAASSRLKLEGIKCLTTLVQDSIIDGIEISRLAERSGVNVFEGVVALALCQRNGIDTASCLEVITAACCSVESTAWLAIRAMSSVSAFAVAICSRAESDPNRGHLLIALFRCCRALCRWHGPPDDARKLWELTIRGVCGSTCEDNDKNLVIEGLLLLRSIISKSKWPHKVPRLQRANFWYQLRNAFNTSENCSAREDVIAICHHLFDDKVRGDSVIESASKLPEVVEMVLECFRSGEPLGVALCAEWLARTHMNQSPIPGLLCMQLSDLSSLSDAHCIALVEVMPTLLDVLDRGQQLESIPTTAWRDCSYQALGWRDVGDRRRRLCSLILVQCLLRAKQVRVMRESVRTFQQVCTLWQDRYTRPENAAYDKVEVTLGIELLVGVCTVLGFSLDQDLLTSRSVSLMRESVVLAEIGHKRSRHVELSLLIVTALDDVGQVHDAFIQEVLGEDCSHIGVHLLTRMVMYSLLNPTQVNADDAMITGHLVLALLQTAAASAAIRARFQDAECDLVDHVAWASHRHDLQDWGCTMDSVCEMLCSLCVDETIAKRVFERRIIHRWSSMLMYVTSPHASLDTTSSKCDRAFKQLTATVLHHEGIRRHNLRVAGALWKPLILHVVMGIVQERLDQDQFDPLQLELLFVLIQQDELVLQELWRVCLLTPDTHCAVGQTTILCALTDPLRDAMTQKERQHAAFVAYSLSTSLQRATPLIQARECGSDVANEVFSLSEVIARALMASTGTRKPRKINLLVSRRSAPSSNSAVASCTTAVWVLRLLKNCLRDKTFTRSLRLEWNLFDQVMASLASPSIAVSCAAALVLRDAVLLQSSQKHIAEVHEQPPQRKYRTLSYFTELRAHDDLFTLTPSTVEAAVLPACFAVVEAWIKLFAKEIGSIQTSVEKRSHLEALQEIALYLVTQCFSQIYVLENGVEDTGDKTVHRAARTRHTTLCTALLQIVCAPVVEEMRRVRMLALELLTALCSFATTQFPADFFCNAPHVDTLLTLLEDTTSSLERFTILRLVREVAVVGAVKTLFGTTPSKPLERLLKWLTEPKFIALQSFATAILRQIVTRSADGNIGENRKRSLAEQQQTFVRIARALFTGKNLSPIGVQPIAACGNGRVLHTVTMAARLDDLFLNYEEASRPCGATVNVNFCFQVLTYKRERLRAFRYRGKLRDDQRSVIHTFVLEPDAGMLLCDVLLTSSRQPKNSTHHQLLLTSFYGNRYETKSARIDHIPVFLTAQSTLTRTTKTGSDDHGVLEQLLADSNLASQVVVDVVAIVAELGKSREVVCAPSVGLGRQILAVMATTQQLQKRIDVTPLNALASWFFESRNSVAQCQSAWGPLLELIQRMRVFTVLDDPVGTTLSPLPAATDGPTFLTSLVEWLTTIEADPLTENCINVLFLENADVLLSLAPLFFPERSPLATFFFLVSMAVRLNTLHCKVFARADALQTMLTLLDGANARPSSETLQHAASAVARIVRAGSAVVNKFLRHKGMDLFGRIAFLVYGNDTQGPWDRALQAAADNLVLASSFLCEAAIDGASTLPTASDRQKSTLNRFTWHSDAERPHELAVMETLLLYLGSRSRWHSDSPSIDTSYERLAARVLRAWVEKWPGDFVSKLNFVVWMEGWMSRGCASPAALAACFANGFRRCIELTQWDYYSELHTLRVSYSAMLSAGVRTGIIPLVCRNAFIDFDRNFLSELTQEKGGTHHAIATALRDVLQFVHEHEMRAQTLTINRKQAFVSRMQVADSGARIATAVHAVLAVVYDAFTDALVAAASSPSSSHLPKTLTEASRVVLAWLALMEQICGLLCCGLDELDPVYYGNVLRQMYVQLVTDLSSNLVKLDTVVRRDEAVRMLLRNLERLLKRLMSKNELRGVTSETEDVAQHAEAFLVQFRQMKPSVSKAFALALSVPDGVKRIQRCIAAAEYVWRRVLHESILGESITSCMAGMKETESLWAKVCSYAGAFVTVVRHPGPLIYAQWQRLRSLLASFAHILDESDSNAGKKERPSVVGASRMAGWTRVQQSDDPGKLDDDQVEAERHATLAEALGLQRRQLLVSHVPFVALESLLDHFGVASSGVRKQISLLNFPELRPRAVSAFARALSKEVEAIEELSASELERELTLLHTDGLREAPWDGQQQQPAVRRGAPAPTSKAVVDGDRDRVGESESTASLGRLQGLLAELQSLVDESDLGIELRVVISRRQPLSLWQLLLTPVRRARLFSAYRRMESFDAPNKDMLPSHGLVPLMVKISGESKVVKTHVHERHAGRNKRRVAVTSDDDPFIALASWDVETGVDAQWGDDPLSEESQVTAVKRALHNNRKAVRLPPWLERLVLSVLLPALRWNTQQARQLARFLLPASLQQPLEERWRETLDRLWRRLTLVLLLLTFWRQEELERDLTNATLAQAFETSNQRQDYFLQYHRNKALDELLRAWMPESGSLGLPLWHARAYFVGGSLLCVAMAWAAPLLTQIADVFVTPETRNFTMTAATYALVLVAFVCVAASMYIIAKKHFVVQQRSRLRLVPLDRYYQNALALVAIAVEIVQLNTISFDPQFNYSETDQIPKLIRWLGALGISEIGVAQVELKAALCAAALTGWLVMLKCANRFQESNAVFNRLVTKDLPAVLHGTLYMGFLSIFFSFLTCIDCAAAKAHDVHVAHCQAGDDSAPFLLSHHAIPCWTPTHAPFALLGLWGTAFFLPIGLLAQGMNNVLFAHEALDVRFAPVVTLFAQLVKAVTATARAFFPFHTTLLASVALTGNALLLVLMVLSGGGASRWYLRHIKCGIFAASGWAAACALYRVRTATARGVATTIAYMGWLAIGGATATWMRVESRRRSDNEQLHGDDDKMEAMDAEDDRMQELQRQLVRQAHDHVPLAAVELTFLRDANAVLSAETHQSRALLAKAAALAEHDEPPELREFVDNARRFANGGQLRSTTAEAEAEAEAVFTLNARRLARKLDSDWVTEATELLPQPGGRLKQLKSE